MDENKMDNSSSEGRPDGSEGRPGRSEGRPAGSEGRPAESEGRPGRSGHGRIWTGLFLLAIGAALLLDQMGFPFPDWLFNWHTLLIIIGVFAGLRSNFRGFGWLIMILIGSFYLAKDNYPGLPVDRFIWPAVLIGIGMLFIFRPHNRWDEGSRRWTRRTDWDRLRDRHNWNKAESQNWKRTEGQEGNKTEGGEYTNWSQAKASGTSADFLDSTAIFGGAHKKVVTKNFRGGDVTSIMGGSEIDLTQADINGIVVLDVTQIMGGTKILVPAHWEVRSQITAVFAGFEDKRQQPAVVNPDKVLILEGTSIFGGIEIRNY